MIIPVSYTESRIEYKWIQDGAKELDFSLWDLSSNELPK